MIGGKSRLCMGKRGGASDKGKIKSVHGGRGPVMGGGGGGKKKPIKSLAVY